MIKLKALAANCLIVCLASFAYDARHDLGSEEAIRDEINKQRLLAQEGDCEDASVLRAEYVAALHELTATGGWVTECTQSLAYAESQLEYASNLLTNHYRWCPTCAVGGSCTELATLQGQVDCCQTEVDERRTALDQANADYKAAVKAANDKGDEMRDHEFNCDLCNAP